MDGVVICYAGRREAVVILEVGNRLFRGGAVASVGSAGLLVACPDENLLQEVDVIAPGGGFYGLVETAVAETDENPVFEIGHIIKCCGLGRNFRFGCLLLCRFSRGAGNFPRVDGQ